MKENKLILKTCLIFKIISQNNLMLIIFYEVECMTLKKWKNIFDVCVKLLNNNKIL
jgi:hypothetical protein